MSGRRRVDESHPDFPEYLRKFQEIWDYYEGLIDKVEEEGKKKYPNWLQGMDSPWGDKKRQIVREESAAIIKLRNEYDYLFVEAEDDDEAMED